MTKREKRIAREFLVIGWILGAVFVLSLWQGWYYGA